MKENVRDMIDLSVFDENDTTQHMMKMLFGCGSVFGFRGSEEHTYLQVNNFEKGVFPRSHPFAGFIHYSVNDLQDKTHKLSIYTDHVRDTKDCMRVPKLNDDPTSDDFGGCIERWLAKLSPGQSRMYCKLIPDDRHTVCKSSGEQLFFYPQCPMGKNTINATFKEGAKILGLPNWETFSPHSLRAYFITRLANGKGVSDRERMDSSRHNSLGASAIYQERDSASETNKFAALGIVPPVAKVPSPEPP